MKKENHIPCVLVANPESFSTFGKRNDIGFLVCSGRPFVVRVFQRRGHRSATRRCISIYT